VKKMNFLLVFAVMLAWFAAPGFAADQYNVAVSTRETDVNITYYGSFAMTADSTANWYTKAMYIGALQGEAAFITAVCSNDAQGTEDVNVFPGFYVGFESAYADTIDLSDKVAFMAAFLGLDQVVNTPKIDSLYTSAAAPTLWRTSEWLVLKFDGQAGHTKNSIISWIVTIPKPEAYWRYRIAATKYVKA
jgi:hypothetical protein